MPKTEPYTYIRIISGVQDRSATSGSLSEDVRMVRSALLYADRVEMFSAGTTLLRQMKEFSGSGDKELALRVYATIAESEEIDPSTRTQLATLVGVAEAYSEQRKQFSRSERRNNPEFRKVDLHFNEVFKGLRRVGNETKRSIDRMWMNYGGNELDAAVDAGLLTINDEWADELIQKMANADEAAEVLGRAITTAKGNLLFDSMAGGLARAMHKEGRLVLPAFHRQNIRTTRLGSNMILLLPNMAQVDVEKVLEVKEEVSASLANYRRSTKNLQEKLREDALSPHLDEEIEQLWFDDVSVQVEELTQAVYDSRLGTVKDVVVASVKEGTKAAAHGAFSVAIATLPSWDLADFQDNPAAYAAFGAAAFSGSAIFKYANQGIEEGLKTYRVAKNSKKQARNDGLFYLANVNHLAN
ncbi:hypothetical protein [Corynebacterium sp. HMSC04H06]|uniref:hypothetical protein n=1 Tax=Corynebacterium sp. HMSC04H06 TaxID=1581050 RepID=UPI0008A63085|nr:hypothetical protein [Corynebacterium sp. HMSC04H06]OFS20032.1 hypothetical protein HMPREF3067_08865 [Corynebacterium sp. HMSC04H06]